MRISDWSSDVCSSDLVVYPYTNTYFVHLPDAVFIGWYFQFRAAVGSGIGIVHHNFIDRGGGRWKFFVWYVKYHARLDGFAGKPICPLDAFDGDDETFGYGV